MSKNESDLCAADALALVAALGADRLKEAAFTPRSKALGFHGVNRVN